MQDEGSVSGASSGASSPEPEAPFIPKFKVRLTDNVNKDGDSVKFTLQVSQVCYQAIFSQWMLYLKSGYRKYILVFECRLFEVAEKDALVINEQEIDNSSLNYLVVIWLPYFWLNLLALLEI